MSKGASLLVLHGETSLDPLRKLKSIFKLAKNLNFQGTLLLKSVKHTDNGRNERLRGQWRRSGRIYLGPFPTNVRGRAPLQAPDPTSDPITSLLKTSRTDLNQT